MSNLLKHYSWTFLKNIEEYDDLFSESERKANKKIIGRLRIKLRDKKAITLNDLNLLLGNSRKKELSKKNRLVMREILMKDPCENSL